MLVRPVCSATRQVSNPCCEAAAVPVRWFGDALAGWAVQQSALNMRDHLQPRPREQETSPTWKCFLLINSQPQVASCLNCLNALLTSAFLMIQPFNSSELQHNPEHRTASANHILKSIHKTISSIHFPKPLSQAICIGSNHCIELFHNDHKCLETSQIFQFLSARDSTMSVGSTEPQAAAPVEPWRAELEEQIAELESWGDEQETEIAAIILKMLLSFPEKQYLATLEASLRIGADYWAKFLPSSWDPLNKPYMRDDKGWPMYLDGVYGTVLRQSWLLRYDDPRQDCLVRLLIDLQNLPKVTYRAYGVRSCFHLLFSSRKVYCSQVLQKENTAYHNDPVFVSACEDNWNAKFGKSNQPISHEASFLILATSIRPS